MAKYGINMELSDKFIYSWVEYIFDGKWFIS